MTATKTGRTAAESFELYDRLIRAVPKIERKGATNPYTSVNGHMFTHMNPAGSLAIRLPKDELERFLKRYKTTLSEAYGVVRKEWAVVPDDLLAKTKELQAYLELSYKYVKTLKPKAAGKSR
jgi:hypothetical protein